VSAYVLSPAAQADLDEIWDFGEATWGADRAELYLRALQRGVETIASDPRRGRACDEIRPGYFKFRVGSHILFYRWENSRANVVRILHQRMDFDRHL
jgi:toxin ParE1/3/4